MRYQLTKLILAVFFMLPALSIITPPAAAQDNLDANAPGANNSDDWLKKLDGAKFILWQGQTKQWFVIHGNHITRYFQAPPNPPAFMEITVIQGGEFRMNNNGAWFTGTIAEDGSSIVIHNYNGQENIFPRED